MVPFSIIFLVDFCVTIYKWDFVQRTIYAFFNHFCGTVKLYLADIGKI